MGLQKTVGFGTFTQLTHSMFVLKTSERLWCYKQNPNIEVSWKLRQALSKNLDNFGQIIWSKVKFGAKLDRTEKLWYVLLHNLWPLLQHFYFWKRDWALGSTSTEFSDFPNTSWFPKIVSLKLFSNLWGNLYTKYLYYILRTILPLRHYVRDCSPSCL